MTYPAPTEYTAHEIAGIAQDVFGLQPTSDPKRLDATTGDIFLIKTPERSILRISFPGETRDNLEFQNYVLLSPALAALPITLPEPLPSVGCHATETIELRGERRLVRLMSFVPGIPVSAIRCNPALLTDAGRSLAALDAALATLPGSAPPQDLVWSVDRALDLLPHTVSIPSPRARELARTAFRNFEQRAMPRLGGVRRQIIHGDFNTGNVLVEGPGAERVSGVIDFGDLTSGPMIQDLAIAAARLCDPEDPVPDILSICGGYASVMDLWPEERAVLVDLICLREAMRLAHWAGEFAKRGQSLSRDIEAPGTKTLGTLLGTEARSRIEDFLETCNR